MLWHSWLRGRALLLIGGTGYLEGALEERVRLRGLERHIRLLGFISEEQLVGCYQAADLFILPTDQMEGFGLVTIEPLSCGTPVIATPVGANPEVIGPLDSALLCHDTTCEAMAERINWWLDRGVSESLREVCRKHCVSRFALERVVSVLERVLAAAVEEKGIG